MRTSIARSAQFAVATVFATRPVHAAEIQTAPAVGSVVVTACVISKCEQRLGECLCGNAFIEGVSLRSIRRFVGLKSIPSMGFEPSLNHLKSSVISSAPGLTMGGRVRLYAGCCFMD